MINEDIQAYLQDFGVTVVAGAVTTKGIFDMPTEILAGNMVISTDYQLTYQTSALPNLAHGQTITVDGASYKVREARLKDDGKLSEAFLSKL